MQLEGGSPFLVSSSYLRARRPISVVQTGVKSAGWEKRICGQELTQLTMLTGNSEHSQLTKTRGAIPWMYGACGVWHCITLSC